MGWLWGILILKILNKQSKLNNICILTDSFVWVTTYTYNNYKLIDKKFNSSKKKNSNIVVGNKLNIPMGQQTDFHDTMHKAHFIALSFYFLTLHGVTRTHIFKFSFNRKKVVNKHSGLNFDTSGCRMITCTREFSVRVMPILICELLSVHYKGFILSCWYRFVSTNDNASRVN